MEYIIAKAVLLGIVCYIIGFIILRKIHKSFLKKKINAQKQCTFEYDNILYLISKEEYKNQSQITNSPIKELFEQKQKNYLLHHDLILNAIRKLETETKQIIYTPEMEKKILRLRKKTALYSGVQKIF
ncbi:hypothetical protein KKG31_06160 [Patescibacteria group bacterium]|nr:hypothetical protein [Patescibacteria group bacterium]MBU1758683.1 hypothetical protein [Patescibacteria group bacterium]